MESIKSLFSNLASIKVFSLKETSVVCASGECIFDPESQHIYIRESDLEALRQDLRVKVIQIPSWFRTHTALVTSLEWKPLGGL